MSGMQTNPDCLFITEKGRAFINEIVLQEL